MALERDVTLYDQLTPYHFSVDFMLPPMPLAPMVPLLTLLVNYFVFAEPDRCYKKSAFISPPRLFIPGLSLPMLLIILFAKYCWLCY